MFYWYSKILLFLLKINVDKRQMIESILIYKNTFKVCYVKKKLRFLISSSQNIFSLSIF